MRTFCQRNGHPRIMSSRKKYNADQAWCHLCVRHVSGYEVASRRRGAGDSDE